MKKVKSSVMLLLVGVLLCLIPNVVKADTKVTRTVLTGGKSMKFEISGLSLSADKQYEYNFSGTKSETEEASWTDVVNPTTTSVSITINAENDRTNKIINKSDKGYISIREKETNTIIESYKEVDLKVPYMEVTDKQVLINGKKLNTTSDKAINVPIRNKKVSTAYYKYEKITDTALINKYKEIKEKSGNYLELASMINKQPKVDSSWQQWSYFNEYSIDGLDGYGYTQETISAPDTGLYYMWVGFQGDGIKDVYGVILVDNLTDEVSLEKITIAKTGEVELGQTLKIWITFTPDTATNKKVTWTSSDETIATVDNTGRVTPKKVGQVIITATSEDGNKTSTCTVTVKEASKDGNSGNEQNSGSGNSNSDNKGGNDDTEMKGKLPQTGINMSVIFGALGMVLVAGESFRRYRKNKV